MNTALPRSGWRFMKFATERGGDAIEEWIEKDVPIGERKGVRAYFATTLRHLRFVPISLWKKPQFRWLSGDEYRGIGEVRFQYNGVAYRPLGCLGPEKGQFTILVGCSKARKRKGKTKWKPMSAPDTAVERQRQLIERRRIPYELDLDSEAGAWSR